MQNKLLTIQETSDRLKLPKYTLRFWEREFHGILFPIRTEGGQRRYTFEHIAILEEIKKLKREGKSLAEIKDELSVNFSKKLDPSNSNRIDLLANRIAEVVKTEVFGFLERYNSDQNT